MWTMQISLITYQEAIGYSTPHGSFSLHISEQLNSAIAIVHPSLCTDQLLHTVAKQFLHISFDPPFKREQRRQWDEPCPPLLQVVITGRWFLSFVTHSKFFFLHLYLSDLDSLAGAT